ncbi:amidohydrolase family protein [Halosimplex salinum]|uniref:amidohydrolase family protein n=1 Tax=Halosimplex salinum TaxID=1710538 RepID=UPI000F4A6B62|nr:amidohydrolase family protein [Halosimplex salinum]
MLIDTHTHAWGADTAELPWTESLLPPGWDGPYTHEALVADMDRVGVDEAVVVSTPLYGRGPRANEYTMRSIEAHPDRLYGVGHTHYFAPGEGRTPADPEALRERVRQVVGHERMLGVRFYAALAYDETPTELDRTGDWITDDALSPVFEELAARDACLYVFPKAEQLGYVADVADEYPDLSVVVDHAGYPDARTDPEEAPWTAFEAVADRSNTYVKVSSLPRSAAEAGSNGGHSGGSPGGEFPYPNLHGYVRALLEWFGPERLLLGSDYPWMDEWADYESCLRWVDHVDWLSSRDAAWLRYRAFDRLHGVSR